MAKRSPTPADAPQETVAETPSPVAVVAEAPAEPPKTGLALLQDLYADPVTREPMALKWRQTAPADRQVVVSKHGTLLFPDGTLAVFSNTEATAVLRYLSALRPNDAIQLSNIS